MKKMTNEKSKECIGAIIGTWEICQNQKYPSAVDVEIDAEDIVALKMAIIALSQEPCDDAISRQAAIDAMRELPHEYRNAEQRARTGGIAACQVIIEELPPVTPQQKGCRWDKLYSWLNDMRLCISPAETTPDDEKAMRLAQVDIIDYIMECIYQDKMEGVSE